MKINSNIAKPYSIKLWLEGGEKTHLGPYLKTEVLNLIPKLEANNEVYEIYIADAEGYCEEVKF